MNPATGSGRSTESRGAALRVRRQALSNIESRDMCLEKCSVEDSFVCRSARYDRFNKTCVLSRHDRRTAPEAFRRSLRQVEYLENQCVAGGKHF
ncbi:apple domain-containing protein [Caerostris extrusa]|uniref:Apple domain-containing protein n=1 Tax=Caerostris extrusa TaxID=172846 RepID=A0AAV4NI43_CAEEX|nr:apple domain-containing protein [Caerostris extrusa]